jgi:hypothetical protein
METTRFLDLDCVRLKNETVELLVTQSAGPRIVRLSFLGGENLLAELPEIALDCPGTTEKMNVFGGHRLWHAPQVPNRTHLPDNQPVTIKEIERGLEVIQPVELQTGFQKSMRVTLPDDSPTIIVDHTLKNQGIWPIETAPWAITALKPGGLAILPQTTEYVDPAGVWPNRNIALWPFTDISSPHIRWGNRFIFVEATMKTGMMKFGFPNPDGWLAYHRNQTLFVKHAAYYPEADYFDLGSSSHFFCQPEFLELETLGPRTSISPGQSASHRETWTLFSNIELEPTEEAVQIMVDQLKL